MYARADQAAQMLTVAEYFHRIGRRGVLMHFAEDGFQRLKHRLLAVEMQRAHFIPGVAIEQIDTADQTLLLLAEAKDIQLAEIEMHHLIAEGGGRVIFQIDDQCQMADFARAVERFRRRRRQTQREMVRDIRHQLLKPRQSHTSLPLIWSRVFRQQPVKPGPRHQLIQIAVIFQRLMADDGVHIRRTVIQVPARPVGAPRRT